MPAPKNQTIGTRRESAIEAILSVTDVNAPESRVSKLKADPRNYAMLAELNVRPRTTYLAKVTNPDPELEKETPS